MNETGDIIKSGGISGSLSGALDPLSEAAEEHANRYYESVRKMTADARSIAENTGFSVEEITSIKEHVFYKEHDLGGDKKERFAPDYDMAQSWQRLIVGKQVEVHDIILIKHELMEIELMNKGYSQQEAHDLTNLKFNYKNALERWRI
ncbi:MAG: hypothetical protein LBB74_01825 [Chitinispirillales bacterium]|jgi:nucleoside-triphosphatase THEP1|nr:hypothetical protein [Chitinispirillales bacterium]